MANSRHGTHSPFVYQLIDKVVYTRRQTGEPRDKVKRLTERLIDWFQPGTVYTPGDGPLPATTVDFVIMDCRNHGKLAAEVEALWPRLHPGSVLVLSNCYRSAMAKALWQSIKANPEVTVTIDLFHLGLVFFHAGQAREDFIIRY